MLTACLLLPRGPPPSPPQINLHPVTIIGPMNKCMHLWTMPVNKCASGIGVYN